MKASYVTVEFRNPYGLSNPDTPTVTIEGWILFTTPGDLENIQIMPCLYKDEEAPIFVISMEHVISIIPTRNHFHGFNRSISVPIGGYAAGKSPEEIAEEIEKRVVTELARSMKEAQHAPRTTEGSGGIHSDDNVRDRQEPQA